MGSEHLAKIDGKVVKLRGIDSQKYGSRELNFLTTDIGNFTNLELSQFSLDSDWSVLSDLKNLQS